MTAAAPEIVDECLGLLWCALRESRNRRFDHAKKAFAIALVSATQLPEEFRPGFRAALAYCIQLDQFRQAPTSITAEMRAWAGALLGQSRACDAIDSFQSLLFEVLTELGELRRAIPFGERALAIAVEKKESAGIADLLRRIGRCYAQLGLRDHAAIAFRASARIFRNETADPRLPAVLLALGNSIRKSAPVEAEALYKEAADLWEKKGQLESASPAWMNLGIVTADQERFDEAIDYYERVRGVRESSPGTAPARIGAVYNNLACCYRKMRRFTDAHQAIERSLRILNVPGALSPHEASSLASSLGTKGMILRDEGRDFESIEWFRRARAEFENQPSPNSENVLEELGHEAAALTRLGRMEEATAVEKRIQAVRQSAAEIPSISYDSDAPVELTEGALLIELDGGMRDKSIDPEFEELGRGLGDILEEQNLGQWHGFVRILESSTLFYYGPNAEAMYAALEPTLRSDSRFEGAIVTIRQRAEQRQVVLPRRRVN